jgi:hypothetical protein
MKNRFKALFILLLAALLLPEIRLSLFALTLLVVATFIIYRLIDIKILAIIIALVVLNYLNSIFTIIIYYASPSDSIIFLDAALTIFSYASITGIVDLLIESWISSQAIGFHITVVATVTVVGIVAMVLAIKNNSI